MRQPDRHIKAIPLILLCWLLVALLAPNAGLSVTDAMPFLGRIVNIILPLGIYLLISSLSKKIGITTIVCLPLLFLAAFQLVLLALYGRSPISADMYLNMITTNSAEAGELLKSMATSFVSIVAFYSLLILAAVVAAFRKVYLPDKLRRNVRKTSYGFTAVGFILLIICLLLPGYNIKTDLYPANVIYNAYLACYNTARTSRQPETSRNFHYGPNNHHPGNQREVYVVVIGETSRVSNWSLGGYGRHTNPKLGERDDLLFSNTAMSESNTTCKSVPMLLTPVSAADYDSTIYKVKSLVTAYHEAGFNTAFFSNQLPNNSLIDLFAFEADTTSFIRLHENVGKAFDDRLLLPSLDEVLRKGNQKQLIVLHAYGSHFDYVDRYLRDEAKFLPDTYENSDIRFKEQLVNAYDNTILMTDDFLNSVIDRVEEEDCVSGIIYTSDHGEDIYDDGHSFLHASPIPSYHQLHVPLLAWLSPSYRSSYPETVGNIRDNFTKPISTSRTFCPLALGIAGIESKKIAGKDDLTSKGYSSSPQIYLNDHNEPVSFHADL